MKKNVKETVGLEIHVQLATKSKLFCSCANESFEAKPNTRVCPICLGHPGVLPMLNRRAVDYILLAGLAFGSEISSETKFDRKNYFYPDLPKGYQITQYDEPFCLKGRIEINLDGEVKKVALKRIHLEEDAGKLIHPAGVDYSLVDFNRAGAPLIEIVTEPVIHSAREAVQAAKKVQEICRYLNIAEADMEKGQMRFDINVNLNDEAGKRLTEISEIKNLNSFKSLEKVIEYELARHEEAYENGEKLVHETRGFDAEKGVSLPQRSKEEAQDYRYFSEPDIPVLKITSALVERLLSLMPELPEAKRKRFQDEYGLGEEETRILIADKKVAEFFENAASECLEWLESYREGKKGEEKKILKLLANWLLSDLFGLMKEQKIMIEGLKMTAENFAELVAMLYESKVSSAAGKEILKEMFQSGGDPSHIMNVKGLKQVDNIDELELYCDQIIAENPEAAAKVKNGKAGTLQFLVGLVMKKTKGKANPAKLGEIFRKKILG